VRRLLDYTRTGRWLTHTVDTEAARAAADGSLAMDRQSRERAGEYGDRPPDAPAAPIRRLFEHTICGHWRTQDLDPLQPAMSDEQRQQLCEVAFFGLAIREIPAEKWQEIVPLFRRSDDRAD